MSFSTIKEIKAEFKEVLKKLYPQQEIDSIVSLVCEEVLNYNRIQQVKYAVAKLDKKYSEQIQDIFLRLVNQEPIQYILGKTSFYDLELYVNPGVLIPRQETELLVDIILRNYPYSDKILDIGTGSGCIALSLKKNLLEAEVFALDISQNALDIAKKNSKANNLYIDFIHGDILNPELTVNQTFNLIVSNPPYVRNSEQKKMHGNVLQYEPHTALFVPDEDPLIYYKAIAGFCMRNLNRGGVLALEINEAFGPETKSELEKYTFSKVEIVKDLNNKDRFIFARSL